VTSQRGMDRDATTIMGLAMGVAALVGAIVEIARSANPGPYGMMCTVGGISYVVGLIVVRRWR
jgi:hypothetical protein